MKDYYSKHTNRTLKIQGKKIESKTQIKQQCAMTDSCLCIADTNTIL